jgi:predicted GTPase/actin-like ATPase involved in cell morphogenesis
VTTKGLGHAIDFGTSNSAIVVCRPHGVTTPVPAPGGTFGSWSIPTAVYVGPDGSVMVGNAAENARLQRPEGYRREFKREFGTPDVAMLGEIEMTAADMTVHVLRFLRQRAMALVPGEPEQVVITVPASWEAGRHTAMRAAAAEAGYQDTEVSLVPEPVAALASVFGDGNIGDDLTALVYDLGGGTFDCAIAQGTRDKFDVLGTPGGIADLGGVDFDGLLLGLFRERLGPGVREVLDGPAQNIGLLGRRLSLHDESERIKWELSAELHYEGLLTAVKPPPWVRVERTEFDTLIHPLLAETFGECERMLGQLGMQWSDVKRMVPTGGSSNIPLVQALLAQSTGVVVMRPDDPARSVVSGAAALCHAVMQGASLELYAKREAAAEPIVTADELEAWLTDDGEPGADPAEEAGAAEFIALLDKHQDKLPTQRKPNILVCGETGTGKTTTINTLFGEEVGEVGYFSRGTSQDELYEWQSEGHNIDVVDLPGLGDNKQRDKEYSEMYRRRVAQADGFIVVIAPPRPANEATIKTVNLLLQCGVNPERIVFAYNRLTDINARIGGKMRRLTLDGLAGPATPDDAKLISMACEAFNADLSDAVRNGRLAGRFPLENVVAYDALSGWNLFAALDAVLESLPGDSLMKWRDAVTRAARDLQRRTEKRLKRETAENKRRTAEVQQQIDRLSGGQATAKRKRGASSKKAPSGATGTPTADGAATVAIRSAATQTGGAVTTVQTADTARRAPEQAGAERKPKQAAVKASRRAEREREQAAAAAERRRQQEQADAEQRRQTALATEERKRAKAEKAAAKQRELERLRSELAAQQAEEARLAREQKAADKISTQRDTHLDKVVARYAAWAAEKVGAAVATVKNVGSAIKRWWRGK